MARVRSSRGGNETLCSFLFFVHSARHDAPTDGQRGQKDGVRGHSVQQRGDFTPTSTAAVQYCFRRVGAEDFIHLIIERISKLHAPENKHAKGNTRSQCNPNKCSVAVAVTSTIRDATRRPMDRRRVCHDSAASYQQFSTFSRGAFQQNMEKNGVKTRTLVALAAMILNNLMCGSIFHLFQSQKGFKTAVVEAHLSAFTQSFNIVRVCG